MILEKRIYKEVSAFSSHEDNFVIPSGQKVTIFDLGGNSPGISDVLVKLVWDPVGAENLIFSTYGDTVQSSKEEFVGDGVKVLRACLINNSPTSQNIGLFYRGTQE